MDRERIHTTTKQHEKTQKSAQVHTRVKRFDLIHLKEAVFSLSPLALKAMVSGLEEEESYDDYEAGVGEEIQHELLENDADMDNSDEDEYPSEDEHDLYFNDYAVLLDEELAIDNSPVFPLAARYVLTVAMGYDKRYYCQFEGPAWFYRRRRLSWKTRQHVHWEFIQKLDGFLKATAKWLEENKQSFLRYPSPENYALGETDFFVNSDVLQKGLLARINAGLTDFHIEEAAFSRLLNNVWLVWPDWNMPLKNLFTTQFQAAWVVEGCTESYLHAHDWPKEDLVYPDFGKADLKNAKKAADSGLDGLDPEERLYVLCDRVGIKKEMVKEIFNRIIIKVKEGIDESGKSKT